MASLASLPTNSWGYPLGILRVTMENGWTWSNLIYYDYIMIYLSEMIIFSSKTLFTCRRGDWWTGRWDMTNYPSQRGFTDLSFLNTIEEVEESRGGLVKIQMIIPNVLWFAHSETIKEKHQSSHIPVDFENCNEWEIPNHVQKIHV